MRHDHACSQKVGRTFRLVDAEIGNDYTHHVSNHSDVIDKSFLSLSSADSDCFVIGNFRAKQVQDIKMKSNG
jgi:hypothetical protein